MWSGVQGDKVKGEKKQCGTKRTEIQKRAELREAVALDPLLPISITFSAVACGSLIFPSFQPKGRFQAFLFSCINTPCHSLTLLHSHPRLTQQLSTKTHGPDRSSTRQEACSRGIGLGRSQEEIHSQRRSRKAAGTGVLGRTEAGARSEGGKPAVTTAPANSIYATCQ